MTDTNTPAGVVEPNYRTMSSGEFLQAVGMDAKKWADAFEQINPPTDHGTMLGWFANAIMAAHDIAQREVATALRFYDDRLRPLVDPETGTTEDEVTRLEFALEMASQDKHRYRAEAERVAAQRDSLRESLDYLLQQTVDQDLKYGVTLSEGEEDARNRALVVIAALEEV